MSKITKTEIDGDLAVATRLLQGVMNRLQATRERIVAKTKNSAPGDYARWHTIIRPTCTLGKNGEITVGLEVRLTRNGNTETGPSSEWPTEIVEDYADARRALDDFIAGREPFPTCINGSADDKIAEMLGL